jgi:hypothetical protein
MTEKNLIIKNCTRCEFSGVALGDPSDCLSCGKPESPRFLRFVNEKTMCNWWSEIK